MPPIDPGIPISSAARQLGVDPGTLRAWQRRYGVGASARSPGGHRRYTREDLDRLRDTRDLIAAGVSTAEAARTVLAQGWTRPGEPVGVPGHDVGRDFGRRDFGGREFGAREPGERPTLGAALDGPDVASAELVEAALGLDGPCIASITMDALTRRGSYAAWEHVLRPALHEVDACAAPRPRRIAAEHLLSHQVSAALLTRAMRADPLPAGHGAARAERVLLTCAPDEQHTLPLLALAATLADGGIFARVLGARTPAAVVHEAAGDGEPLAIVVLALRDIAARTRVLAARRGRSLWVAAGPGWTPSALPAGVAHVNGLAGAAGIVHTVTRRVRPSTR